MNHNRNVGFLRPLLFFLALFYIFIICCLGFVYATESDVHYKDPVEIDDTQMITATSDCFNPILMIDTNGTQHIFWMSKFHEGTVVTHGTLDPVVGSITDIVYVNEVVRSFQANIAVAQKDNGSIAVVWRDDINFKESIYGSIYEIEKKIFTKPVQLYIPPPSNRIMLRPDVACSSSGLIWVGWIETLDGQGSKFCAKGFNGTFSPATDTIILNQSQYISYSLSDGPELVNTLDGEVLSACSFWDSQTNKNGINIYHIDAKLNSRLGGNIETDRSISGDIFFHRLDESTNHLFYSTTMPGKSDPSIFMALINPSGYVNNVAKVLDTKGEVILDIYSSKDGSKAILFQSAGASHSYWISLANNRSTEFSEKMRVHDLWTVHDYQSGSLFITNGEAHIITVVHLAHQPTYTLFLHLTRIKMNDGSVESTTFLVPGRMRDPSRSDGVCAIDEEGIVHVLFVDDRNYFPNVYYTSFADNTNSSESQLLETMEYCLNAKPRLLIHSDGRLTAFWWRIVPEEFTNWNYSIVTRTSSDNGTTWSPSTEINRGNRSWSWTDYNVISNDDGTMYLIITGSMTTRSGPEGGKVGFLKVYHVNRNGSILQEALLDSGGTGFDSRTMAQPFTFFSNDNLFILFSNSPQSLSVSTPASISSVIMNVETSDFGSITRQWATPTDEFFGFDLYVDSTGKVWVTWTQRNDTAAPSTSLWVAEFDSDNVLLLDPLNVRDLETDLALAAFYFPQIRESLGRKIISTFYCNWSFSELSQQWVGIGGVAIIVQNNNTSDENSWRQIELYNGITLPPVDSWGAHYYPDDIGIISFSLTNSATLGYQNQPLLLTSFPDNPYSKHGNVLMFLPNGVPSLPEIITPINGSIINDAVAILSVTKSIDPDGDPVTYKFSIVWAGGQEKWTSPWMNSTKLAFRWTSEGQYTWTLEVSDQYMILEVPWIGSFQTFGNAPFADAGGPYIGWEGEPISLNASSSWDDSGIVRYEWDLDGDGSMDIETTNPIISHTWMDDIADVITLKVTDVTGSFSYARSTVVVMNRPPIPTIEIDGELFEGYEITFNCIVDDASPHDTFMYFWVIDGYENKSGPLITQIFDDNGEYIVTMNVIDDDNGIGHWEKILIIMNIPPSIDPIEDIETWEDLEVTIDPTVHDVSKDNLTFEWSITKVSIGTERSLNYTFSEPGEYSIKLEVFDKDNDMDTMIIQVTVLDRIIPVTLNMPEAVTESTVKLNWTMHKEYGFISYIIRVSTTPRFDNPIEVAIDDPTMTTSHINNLKPGTYYYAIIELQCLNGTSYSNTVTFYTKYEQVSVWSPWSGMWIIILLIIVLLVAVVYIRNEKRIKN
jgi:hypothetical protein